MATVADRALAALRVLLRSSHLAGPDHLPVVVSAAGGQLGAVRAVLYLADYDQLLLVPLAPTGPAAAAARTTAEPDSGLAPIAVDGTLAGRAYRDLAQLASASAAGRMLWTPVLDGTERLGVLRLDFGADVAVEDELRAACLDVAAVLAELVMTPSLYCGAGQPAPRPVPFTPPAELVMPRSLYGDAVQRPRRRVPLTLPAELAWQLLPPLAFVSPSVAVAGVLAPSDQVAGDSFDYALNGTTLSVAIFDAMGHGLEAATLATVAVAALRNARRGGLDLRGTVHAVDTAIGGQFGPDKFVTGILGELDISTGWWCWTTCGHHPALLVRDGKVVKTLDSVVGAPLGLGLLDEPAPLGQERLQPGDRLLLYTDGVIEARDSAGEVFGTHRLVELATRQNAAGRAAAETLRRLTHAILRHQDGDLQDDATTVLVEWLTSEPRRVLP